MNLKKLQKKLKRVNIFKSLLYKLLTKIMKQYRELEKSILNYITKNFDTTYKDQYIKYVDSNCLVIGKCIELLETFELGQDEMIKLEEVKIINLPKNKMTSLDLHYIDLHILSKPDTRMLTEAEKNKIIKKYS